MKNLSEIKIQDKHNSSKVHVFLIGENWSGVTNYYNQEISGNMYYDKFSKIDKKFGYNEYYYQALESAWNCTLALI